MTPFDSCVEKSSEVQGKRLTLKQSRNALIAPLCLTPLFAAFGVSALTEGHKVQAGFFCVASLAQLTNVPALWKQYHFVKQGGAVYSAIQTYPLIPKTVSVVVALILTGVTGVSSVMIVLLASANFNTPEGWIAAGLILAPLWLYTGYCWYRIYSGKRQVFSHALQKQPEGVWPPAPSAPFNQDNKD